MRIVTDYWRKPIPTDAYDWSAIDGDTYDQTGNDEDGYPTSSHPIGYGRTEQEAIDDLLSQMED